MLRTIRQRRSPTRAVNIEGMRSQRDAIHVRLDRIAAIVELRSVDITNIGPWPVDSRRTHQDASLPSLSIEIQVHLVDTGPSGRGGVDGPSAHGNRAVSIGRRRACVRRGVDLNKIGAVQVVTRVDGEFGDVYCRGATIEPIAARQIGGHTANDLVSRVIVIGSAQQSTISRPRIQRESCPRHTRINRRQTGDSRRINVDSARTPVDALWLTTG